MTTVDLGRLPRGQDGQIIVGQTGKSPQWRTLSGDVTIDEDGAVTVGALTDYLLKSENLNDLPNKATARTNLGVTFANLPDPPTLGTAAALDVGTGANKVVQLTAAAKYPAVDGSLITNLSYVPLSSTTPVVGTVISAAQGSGGNVTNGSTTSGANLGWTINSYSGCCGNVTTHSPFAGGSFPGTWKNITGGTILNKDWGVWVRTA